MPRPDPWEANDGERHARARSFTASRSRSRTSRCVDADRFRDEVLGQVAGGARIAALFGRPRDDDHVRLYAVLANDQASTLSLLTTDVADSYPALTPDCPQAHWFEREIAEQWGIVPRGHPWLKPIRFHRSYRAGT